VKFLTSSGIGTTLVETIPGQAVRFVMCSESEFHNLPNLRENVKFCETNHLSSFYYEMCDDSNILLPGIVVSGLPAKRWCKLQKNKHN
jgi:hypothetical protein